MRNYPQLFSQRDPRWASILINAQAGCTLGLYGCLIISWEMKCNYYRHLLTPPQLMNLLATKKLFVDGDFINSDADLNIVFPDITYMQTLHYESGPADLDALCRLSDDETLTGTLELDFDHDPSDGIQTHFVELHTCVKNPDGTYTIRIYDPWDGKEKDFTEIYGVNPEQTIQKVLVYKGAPGVQPTDQAANTLPVNVDEFKRLVTGSSNADTIGAYFGLDSEAMKDPTAGGKVIDEIKAKDEQISRLQDQLQVQPHQTIPVSPASALVEPVTPTPETPKPPVNTEPVVPEPLQTTVSPSNQAKEGAVDPQKPTISLWVKVWRALVLLNPFN